MFSSRAPSFGLIALRSFHSLKFMGTNYTRSLTTARRLQSLQRQMGPSGTSPSGTTPKRLIVLCDGTWQNSVSGERFSYPTNVTRFSRALSQFGVNGDGRKVPQIIYYQPGVGTGGLTDKLTGGVYGAGLSANVRAAYGFLAHNYNPGDQIYFFGYSRGAYTARAIAGLITSMGLLTKRGMDQFGAVYQEYYKNQKDKKGAKNPNITKLGRIAGGELHSNAENSIEIIGVWDTVGFHHAGLGDEEFEFYNTKLSKKVNHGFHALSLDETREAFLPTLWDSENKKAQQVWFCGTHGIGGGAEDSGLADIALGWMIAECHKTGTLSFVDIGGKLTPPTEWYLLDPSTPPPHSTTSQWKTAHYPPQATASTSGREGFFGGLSSLFNKAQDLLWTVTNLILPSKSGVRTPNAEGLPPENTSERVHQSITDRRLDSWPCGPIEGRSSTNSTHWKVRYNGAVLKETLPDSTELEFKANIRPVNRPLV